MKKIAIAAFVLVTALLLTGIFAQDAGRSGAVGTAMPKSHQGMGGGMGGQMGGPMGGMGGQMSPQQHEQMMIRYRAMMQQQQQMLEELRAQDARLDKLAAAMNSATGEARVGAIVDVLNELIAQRRQEHQRTYEAQARTMGGMGMMGGMGHPGGMMGTRGTTGTMESGGKSESGTDKGRMKQE